MPNWCENELEVSGPPVKVEEFKQKVRSDDDVLAAGKIIPYPRVLAMLDKLNPFEGEPDKGVEEELEQLKLEGALEGYDLQRDGFNQGGYEWCIKNWGTKWGFCEPIIADESEGSVSYKLTLRRRRFQHQGAGSSSVRLSRTAFQRLYSLSW